MTTINTCEIVSYNPLIAAIEAICLASQGEELEVVMNNGSAFQDLKEYLAQHNIGFREIYAGQQMTLQFSIG